MLGRSWCPCSRDAGIAVAVATGVIMSVAGPEGTPTPGVFGGHKVHSVVRATPAAAEPSGDLPEVHARDGCSTDWTLEPVPVRAHRLGGRALPRRRASRCAAAGTAGRSGRTLAFVVVGMGAFFVATPSGAGGVRHDAAQRAHGPAHGAVDGGAAGPGARRAGHAGAAHAAARGRGAGCSPCCTRGSRRCCRSRRSTFALYVVSPWALYFSGWYDASLRLDVRPRADARAPRAGRLPVLLAADGRRPGARAGWATRSGCCWSS